MKKAFDVSQPHEHGCSRCYKPIDCRAINCEIPQFAECLECREAGAVESVVSASFLGLCGYRSDGRRKTWPGRFAVEHYTLPLRERRNRRGI